MRTKKISLLLALVLVISAIALPLTAYAAGDKDTTPPELTASLDGDTLKIESSDDNSGVEAVFVDGNRINSLTNGAASVTLKDYAGTGKQVSVYAQDYAGNRSKTVKFENPYYEEPAPTEKPATTVPQNQSSKPVKPAQAQAASSGSTNQAVILPGMALMRVRIRAPMAAAIQPPAQITAAPIPRRKQESLPLFRMARLPRREPAQCWMKLPARVMISSFIPLPPRPGMCSILSLTASVTTTTSTS